MVLLKQLFTYSIVVLIFICTASQSSAQNSKKAKKSYDKALKLIEKGKYDDVFSLLLGAVMEEKELEEGQDRKFIGEVFALYARFFVSETYYGAASQYFFLAALNYQRGGHIAEAQAAIKLVSFYEDSARKYQSFYGFESWNTEREYSRYPVSSIDKTSGDTTWFTMDLGIRDSIRIDQSGWFVAIYDASKPERYIEALGQTTVVSIDQGRSQWYMVMSDDGKASGFTPQIGDLNYMEIGANPDAYDGLIQQLTRFHIPFLGD